VHGHFDRDTRRACQTQTSFKELDARLSAPKHGGDKYWLDRSIICNRSNKQFDKLGRPRQVNWLSPRTRHGADYLKTVATTDPRTFCALFAKILPTQVTGDAVYGSFRKGASTPGEQPDGRFAKDMPSPPQRRWELFRDIDPCGSEGGEHRKGARF
jgi:hypothetical protein